MNDVDEIVANAISPAAEIGEEIRCENWAANPGLCGADCHLVFPPMTARTGISLAQWAHSFGWLTLESAEAAGIGAKPDPSDEGFCRCHDLPIRYCPERQNIGWRDEPASARSRASGASGTKVQVFSSLACLLDWLQREHPDVLRLVRQSRVVRELASQGGGE